MDKLELTILSNLVHNEDYSRKVIPFIKLDYFDVRGELIVCQEIIDFIAEYNKAITPEILSLEIQNREDLTEQEFKDAILGTGFEVIKVVKADKFIDDAGEARKLVD